MSASEGDLRRGLAVLDYYRAQIDSLAQQQEIVRMSLEEHLRAKETLVRFQQAGPHAEVLVPVGANSFVVAEVRDPERAYVGIGSDLVIFDAISSQTERLESRIKSMTEAANALSERLADAQRRAEAQGAFVQEAYETLQAAKGERT